MIMLDDLEGKFITLTTISGNNPSGRLVFSDSGKELGYITLLREEAGVVEFESRIDIKAICAVFIDRRTQ